MNKIIVRENEELVLPVVWTGKEREIDYDISLAKAGASVTLLMLLLGEKENSVNVNINIIHQKPQTKSKVIVKGVVDDKASVNFNGLVRIDKGSKGSNAWLAVHLLLLSDKAKGKTVPSLEILENDVKAGHATTVGRVNDLEMFYLMSRGLSKQKARKIIIDGFLSGFLNDFPKSYKEDLLLLKP